MQEKSLSQKIQELISPEFGKELSLTFQDENFIASYQNIVSSEDDISIPRFKNIILGESVCGILPGGQLQYLLNTDLKGKFSVVIRTSWWMDGFGGYNDHLTVINPGSKIFLGCTDSGTIPVTTYSRAIIKETRMIPFPTP